MLDAAVGKDFNQDWWQREKRRRQNRVLLFLVLLLILIAFFYWQAAHGRTGGVGEFDFDTKNHIAFINQGAQGNTALYVVRADGTNLRRMTAEDDKSTKREPAWTMDGKSILFSSNRGNNQTSQIWRMGNGETKQLTYGSGQKFTPFANPDGKRAGFIVQGSVKTVYLNGNEVVQILPPPSAGSTDTDNPNELANSAEPRGPYLTASPSFDGRSIAGVQSLNPEDNPAPTNDFPLGEQVVRVLTPAMEKASVLDTGRETSLSWQGDLLTLATAFTEAETKDDKGKKVLISGIRLWDVSTAKPTTPKQIFTAVGFTVEPKNVSLSPDGKRIAFEIWRLKGEGNRELRGIVVMDTAIPGGVQTPAQADKIPITLPVIDGGRPQMPRWSPDGSRLLYEVVKGDTSDLWIVNADGTNPLNLTKNLPGLKSQAAWAPSK